LEENSSDITLSIVIVNYNVRYFLKQCLLSVQKAIKEISSEIIVVDNASIDDSCSMIKTKFKDVVLIKNQDNVGFSKANNQGVQIAKGKYVLILNPDTVLAEDTLNLLLKFVFNKKNIGAVGVKFIDGSGQFLPESKRGIPTPKVAFGKLFGFPKSAINTYYASHIDENEIDKIEILTGAFMLLKKEVYQEVNGFDEDYFMYGEDIDLSYKILKKGYQNYYFGKTKIIHYKGESTTKDKKFLKRFYDAIEIFYKKHFKVNAIANLLMFIGIKFWYTLKLVSLKKRTHTTPTKANKIIYIGKNEATFAKVKLAIQPELAIFHQDISVKDIVANKPDKIIFDMHFLQYKVVFSLMEKLQKLGISFRFIPNSANFIIGSDDNKSKGEVITF